MSKERLENLDWEAGDGLEHISCPLCNDKLYVTLLVERGFNIVRCASCMLVYVNPRPSEKSLGEFYDQYYPPESTSLWERQMARVFEVEGLKRLNALMGPGHILDVGCGYGFFLKMMKEKGWEVSGVEPSALAGEYAQTALGPNIFRGTLSEARFEAEYFDAVTLWYVLEHVPGPLEILLEVNRILKRGGVIILRVPNNNVFIDRLIYKLGGQSFLINPPRHLFDYTADTIRKMLEKASFGEINIVNSIPRATGTPFELARRYVWYYLFEAIFRLTRGKMVNGSSITVFARKT